MAINGINGIDKVFPSISGVGLNKETTDNNIIGSFGDYLNSALKEVSKLEMEASKITDEFAAGKTDNIHQVMIAAQKSEIALQFTMQIRNKIVEAYQEIMRMQV
ncbi:MAG: flagellar hook-basal body complex protein FliE [Clostridiaceae bacterium]|nr:flagellar hook-basal body complex protein FliE [Clostridiaceae bacterium]